MNFRKLSISLFTVFFGVLLLYSSSSALTIISREINKVSVSFIPSEDANILKGKIWKKGDLSDATKVKLELIDSQKAIVLRQEIPSEGAQKKEDYWEIDFSLELSVENLSGEYTLKAEVFNKDNRLIAFGQGQKTILGESREISIISDLTVKVDKDMVKGGIKFQNKERDGEFKAKIDIYKDDNAKSFMGTFLSESFSIKKGETEEIFFTFSKPADPQLYNAEVSVIQEEKEITGKLVKSFLIEGDFAEFYEAKVSPEKYFGKGDTIEVDFSGITTTEKDKVLSVEINITDNDGFSAQKFVNISPNNDLREFKGKEVFLATQGVDQVFVELILWNENDELGRFKTSTKKFKKPRENSFIDNIKKVQSGEKLSNSDKYKIVAILVFILLAILLFIRGLVRSNKNKSFFIFLAMIIVSGTAFASYPNVEHHYPQNGLAYNSNTDSGYFNKIGFWGYASGPLIGGYLPTSSVDIPYKVTLTGMNSEGVFTSTGTYTNSNSYEYKFSISLSDTDFPEGVPVDGNYTVELVFSGSDIETRFDEIGLPDETEIDLVFNLGIIIDSTNPSPKFNFAKSVVEGALTEGTISNGPDIDYQEGDYINDKFGIQPKCNDGQNGTGCFTDFAGFYVRGNFCDSAEDDRSFCSGDGTYAHEFKICDLAGNCKTESADIDFYDPVSPTEGGGDFINNLGAGGSIFNLDIYNGFPFFEEGTSGDNVDPVDIAATSLYNFGLRNVQDASTESGLPEDDAFVCKNSSEFTNVSNICIENIIACAESVFGRGECVYNEVIDDYVFEIDCPDNFEDNGSGECIPSCYYDRFPYCFSIIVDSTS